MPITYGSVCSGIEAATQAWHPLGMCAAWFAEIEPFPSAVLAHHYPGVPNHGDMTKLAALVLAGKIPAPDVLVGGTPCQDFSVAGMRAGLGGERGQLTIKFVELADAIDHVRTARGEAERVLTWENVPGVLSDKGNAFGCFLGALAGEDCELQPPGKKWQDAGCVYGPKRTIAWRVLDAQYFGLAQRRRRVFVVASARDGFDPTEVLFEREGVRRDTAPRRGEGQDVAGTIAGGARKNGGYSADDIPHVTAALTTNPYGDHESRESLLVFGGNNTSGPIEVAPARNACASASGRMDFESEAFVVHGTQDPYVQSDQAHTHSRNNGQDNVLYCREVALTGTSNHGEQLDNTNSALGPNVETHAIQAGTMRANPASEPDGVGVQADYAYTLEARAEVQAIQAGSAVRRLTPVECERLQGMTDDYTLIPWRGKPASECPDGPRYKAIGNSKAVTVVRWLGRRIQRQMEP
jgi:DNA (cytosine-5)-methyltransferase 1